MHMHILYALMYIQADPLAQATDSDAPQRASDVPIMVAIPIYNTFEIDN